MSFKELIVDLCRSVDLYSDLFVSSLGCDFYTGTAQGVGSLSVLNELFSKEEVTSLLEDDYHSVINRNYDGIVGVKGYACSGRDGVKVDSSFIETYKTLYDLQHENRLCGFNGIYGDVFQLLEDEGFKNKKALTRNIKILNYCLLITSDSKITKVFNINKNATPAKLVYKPCDCYLYVMNFNDEYIKVGISYDVDKRKSELMKLSGVKNIEILYKYKGDRQRVYKGEQYIHKELESQGLDHKESTWSTETFQLNAIAKVKQILDSSSLVLTE